MQHLIFFIYIINLGEPGFLWGREILWLKTGLVRECELVKTPRGYLKMYSIKGNSETTKPELYKNFIFYFLSSKTKGLKWRL